MNLVAPPALSDHHIRTSHDGCQASVIDPDDAAPVVDALGTKGHALAGILVMRLCREAAGAVPGLAATKPRRQDERARDRGLTRHGIASGLEPLPDGDAAAAAGRPGQWKIQFR